MKVGILSDIHANLEALQAMLKVLQDAGAAKYICCGDIVGYGPNPNECVDIVRGLHCACVAGNHDFAAVGRIPVNGFNDPAVRALEWTRDELKTVNRIYLENLPLTEHFDPMFIVHASPAEPEEWAYVLTLREAEEEMDYFPDAVCLIGHSHYPFVAERLAGGSARLVGGDGVRLQPGAKYVVNAGSVGQPRDGNSRACGMLYNTKTESLSYLRAGYDIPATQKKIRAAGLPEYLATRLAQGR